MNKAILMGRLTKNPEVRYTSRQDGTQTCIARFTLAVNRRIKQEGQQNANFISCVAFGRQGEFAEKYLMQGTKIELAGRIQTGSYTNKDGQKVYTTDVVVEEIEFAESKNSTSQSKPQEEPKDTGFVDIPDGIEDDLPFH
jgi:single-strand DNA-binding protein